MYSTASVNNDHEGLAYLLIEFPISKSSAFYQQEEHLSIHQINLSFLSGVFVLQVYDSPVIQDYDYKGPDHWNSLSRSSRTREWIVRGQDEYSVKSVDSGGILLGNLGETDPALAFRMRDLERHRGTPVLDGGRSDAGRDTYATEDIVRQS